MASMQANDSAPERSLAVAGLGVDIVEVARMETILARTPRFRQRVFTEAERAYCDAKARPAVHYATHFAAKEAIVKALGCGFSDGVAFTDAEVGHNDKGRPIALLHGRAAQIAAEQGIVEVHISLSRTNDTAVANAVASTEATKPVPAQEQDAPKQQIANAFRELRSMLDEDAPASAAVSDPQAASADPMDAADE